MDDRCRIWWQSTSNSDGIGMIGNGNRDKHQVADDSHAEEVKEENIVSDIVLPVGSDVEDCDVETNEEERVQQIQIQENTCNAKKNTESID